MSDELEHCAQCPQWEITPRDSSDGKETVLAGVQVSE